MQRTENDIDKESYKAFNKNNQKEGFVYTLIVADNGKGIQKEKDIQNAIPLDFNL